MDGQRLVLVNGTYGYNGSEYRTELDSFSRIFFYRTSTERSFVVEHKSGQVSYYGSLDGNNSALFKPGGTSSTIVLSWSIRKVVDLHGNSILYTYEMKDDKQHVVTDITYTGTSNTEGDRKIVFSYTGRWDTNTTYLAGFPIHSIYRLDSVTSFYQSQVVRKYELGYKPSATTERNLLSTVTECASDDCVGGDGGNSLPKTMFTYQEPSLQYETKDLSTELFGIPATPGEETRFALHQVQDFDGDGLRDLYIVERDLLYITPNGVKNYNGSVIKREIALSSDGFDQRHELCSGSDCNPVLGFMQGFTMAGGMGFLEERGTDFNQDGKSDLLGLDNDGNVSIMTWKNDGFEIKPSNLLLSGLLADNFIVNWSDFNGNGKLDLLLKQKVSGEDHTRIYLRCSDPGMPVLSNGCTCSSSYIPGEDIEFCLTPIEVVMPEGEYVVSDVLDLDGNGVEDIFVDWDGANNNNAASNPPKVIFLYNNNNTLTSYTISLSSIGGPNISAKTQYFNTNMPIMGFHDLNADGLMDYYMFPEKIYINKGGTFESHPIGNMPEISEYLSHRFMMMDYDADGITEILVPSEVTNDWTYLVLRNPSHPYQVLAEPYFCSTEDPATTYHFGHGNKCDNVSDRTVYRWNALEYLITGDGQIHFVFAPTTVNAPIGVSQMQRDFRGDGLTDIAYRLDYGFGKNSTDDYVVTGWYATGTGMRGFNASINTDKVPDLLISAEKEQIGQVSRWEHNPLSSNGSLNCQNNPFYTAHHEGTDENPWDKDHFMFTSTMHVVSTFEQSNAVGSDNAVCYRYEDAVFNNKGRGFQGFTKIIAVDDIPDDIRQEATKKEKSKRVTTSFHTRFPFAGMVKETRINLVSDTDTENPISLARTTWESNCQGSFGNGTRRCFVYASVNKETAYDLDSRDWLSTITTTTVFNSSNDKKYGNPSKVTVVTKDDTMQHTKEMEYSYDYSDEQDWWVNKLEQETITFSPINYTQGITPYSGNIPTSLLNDDKIITVDYTWHSTGRLLDTKTTTDSKSGTWGSEEYPTYDEYGNPTEIWTNASGLANKRETQFEYTTYGYFVNKTIITNANVWHITETTTDPATGLVTENIDANELSVVYDYDDFGNLLKEVTAGVQTVYHRLFWCDGDATCPTLAIYKKVTVQNGSPIKTDYLDQAGRLIKSTITGFNGGTNIVMATKYDERGWVIRESKPSTSANGAYFTEYQEHDALGRVGVKIEDRTGYPRNEFVTHYYYSGLKTDITLQNDLTASRTYNIMGRLISTKDTMGYSTGYLYDTLGNPIVVEDSGGNQIQAYYNSLGHKQEMEDPNRGLWQFEYNGLGELTWQKDANQDEIENTYDDFGRMVLREVKKSGQSNFVTDGIWDYDLTYKGTLSREEDGKGYERSFEYDSLVRPIKTTTYIDDLVLVHEQAYDSKYGRVKGMMYPTGEVVAMRYDKYGYLTREDDPLRPGLPGSIYREVLQMNPMGQVTRELFGNGLYGTYGHLPTTGELKTSCVSSSSSTSTCTAPDAKQSLEYFYNDSYYNLSEVTDHIRSITETYTYDNLHRIRHYERAGSGSISDASVNYTYDPQGLGNIISKTDYAPVYEYGDRNKSNASKAGPHAVREITKTNGQTEGFEYDLNGNLLTGDGLNMSYDVHNLPVEVIRNGSTSVFTYGPDLQRYRQDKMEDGKSIYYVGKTTEVVVDSSTRQIEETRDYIGGYLIVTHKSDGRELNYQHRDRLGSVKAITEEDGDPKETHLYGPFGKPNEGTQSSSVTPRGFTDHEHLDDQKIIHMNGRAYDYNLGRFLEVDPFISDPGNSQALNPYSYIMNNPLAGVDPTGYVAASIVADENVSGNTGGYAYDPVNDVYKFHEDLSKVNTSKFMTKTGGLGFRTLVAHNISTNSSNIIVNNGKGGDGQSGSGKNPGKIGGPGSPKTESNNPSSASKAEQERIDYASFQKDSNSYLQRKLGSCKRIFEESTRRYVNDDDALAVLREATEATIKLGDLSHEKYLSLQNISPISFTGILEDSGKGIGEMALIEGLKNAGMNTPASMLGKASSIVGGLMIGNDFLQMAGGDAWGRMSRGQQREMILKQVVGKLAAGRGNMGSRVFNARARYNNWSGTVKPLVLQRITRMGGRCPTDQIR